MKKILKIILYCAVFLPIIITVIIQLHKNTRCITYDNFLKISLNGVVVNKYIDSSQHSFETIEIKNFKNLEINKLILDLDTSDLYNNINIQDTIFKEINKDSVFMIKSNQKYLLSKVDFGCTR